MGRVKVSFEIFNREGGVGFEKKMFLVNFHWLDHEGLGICVFVVAGR